MTTTIHFTGAAGGVGTTTMAALTAFHIASTETKVLAVDATGTGDLPAAMAGLGTPAHGEKVSYSDTLDFAVCGEDEVSSLGEYDVIVIDHGRKTPTTPGMKVVVARTDYVSARHLPNNKIDFLAILNREGSALTEADVMAVAGVPLDRTTAFQTDPALARAVDAGVLGTSVGKYAKPIVCMASMALESGQPTRLA